MSTPTPAPTPNANSAMAAAAAAGISLPNVGPSSGNPYGLPKEVAGLPVQLGNLLPSLIGTGNVTVQQAMDAFAKANQPGSLNASMVAQIQQRLLLAGMYSDSKYQPQYGVINPEDVQAFGKLLTLGGQTGAQLDTYLQQKAEYGQQAGLAAAIASTQRDVHQITHANPIDLADTASKVFQNVLGRKATPAEIAGFQAAFDHTTTALQQSAYDQMAQAKANSTPSAADLAANPALGTLQSHADPTTAATPGSAAAFAMAEHGDGSTSGKYTIDDLVHAVGGQESGGNYNDVNKDSGASGKYQIMPANWPQWAHEAGLSSNAPQTPANQEIVARFKLAQYANKYGLAGAAAAWYGGEGAAQAYVRNPTDPNLQRKQGGGRYPSVADYVAQVTGRMHAGPANQSPGLLDTSQGGPDIAAAQTPITIDQTSAPSAAVAAENYARRTNPGLAGAHDITNQFSSFLGLLSGHFGAGSNL